MIRVSELMQIFTNAEDLDAKFAFRYEGYILGSDNPDFIPSAEVINSIGYYEVASWSVIYHNNDNGKSVLILITIKKDQVKTDEHLKLPTREEVIKIFDIKMTTLESDIEAVTLESVNNEVNNISKIEIFPITEGKWTDDEEVERVGPILDIRLTATENDMIVNFSGKDDIIREKLKKAVSNQAPKSLFRASRADLSQ